MKKDCKQCGGGFEVTDDDLEFLERIAPSYSGVKYSIPVPDYCPQCRLERRMSFRNEKTLYHRKCDATGADMISCYAPDSGYKVYDYDYWWGDKWDGVEYGRDFDFSRTFTEQMKELCIQVPRNRLINTNCQNCDFTNYLLNSQNCYLVFGGSHDEDCMYGKFVVNSKNVCDCLSVNSCEYCYEANSCESCYYCKYAFQCRNCSDCLMVEECSGCRNCIACFGLRNQEYCFMNERVGKEKYEEIAKWFEELTYEKISEVQEKFENLKKDLPHVYAHIYNGENCTGDNILNSKNCKNCYDIRECEDCKNINFAPFATDCRDHIFSAPGPTETSYQTCSIVETQNSMSLFMVWHGGSNIFYSMECHSVSDCFGCVGLKKKQYCILNKQYSRKEYDKLVPQIIEHMRGNGEWGQFLDPKLSFFGHNEAITQEYFPISKEEALKRGFNWRDEEIVKIGKAEGSVMACEACGKNYRTIPEELKFYKRMRLPLPKNCYDCRHMERINRRQSFKLNSRKCSKCAVEIETIYSDESKEKVYCEKCYLEEVY